MIEALLERRSILAREPRMILRETIRRRHAKDGVAKDRVIEICEVSAAP
jgi:hypothetical protein